MRVLVVDDDPGIRESLRLLLEDEGYDVSVAGDGEVGLRNLLESSEPLVILLDLLLPNLSGEDMLAAALEYFGGKTPPRIAFIIITANPWLLTPRLNELAQRHTIQIEKKPFDADHLLAEVARAAARVRNRIAG